MRLVHLVQDRGIKPGARKGAAVHVNAMCDAFREVGLDVFRIQGTNADESRRALDVAFGHQVDLLYERYALGAFEGAAKARSTATPHVLEVNAPLEDEAKRWRGEDGSELDRATEAAMFHGASLVLCVSPMVADYAVDRGARPETILVRPNGVDSSLFRPMEDSDDLRRHLFSAIDDPFVVGFHGRLRPWHGFERIVTACREVLDREVNVAVLCVGEGDFESPLSASLPRERWRHIRWCDQKALARYVAGFHVVPFGYDAQQACYFSPLKLREAMAAGAVPIVPRLGDLAEMIDGGRAGVLFDPDDPTGLADAIESLARQPEVRTDLAVAAREAAMGASWEQIAKDVLERTLGAPR